MAGLRRDYRGVVIVGPGGLSCPCCSPYRCHPRKAKPLLRRRKRRTDKFALRVLVLLFEKGKS